MANLFRRLFGSKERSKEPRDIFAEQVIAAVRGKAPEIDLEYDQAGFELRHVGETARGQRTFLHNSFVEHGRLPADERAEHLERIAAFIIESGNPNPRGELALDGLMPVLRARADILAATDLTSGFSYEVSSRPFCDNMLVMLAIDTETAIRLVTDETLQELNISFDEALGVAIGHLDERGNHVFGKLADGTYVSNCGDYYDCSRVLIPALFENLEVRGNPVVIIQARSAILVTGSEDMDGLGMIADFAIQDFPENERAVSMTPIELRAGHWRPLEIKPTHPQSLRNLRAQQTAWSYDATQKALQNTLGEDIYVASAILLEHEGRFGTIATWADGVTTACPLVDTILIQNPADADGLWRSMEAVVDVCGPFKTVEQLGYPIRWILPPRPDAHAIERLRKEYPDHRPFGD